VVKHVKDFMTHRPLEVKDLPMLQEAMDNDTLRPGQSVSEYAGKHMESFVYEDDAGPVGVLRYTKALRLCTVWCDAEDRRRNGATLMSGIEEVVRLAESNGFTEIILQTDSPLMAKFCTDKLGFEESRGEYVRHVTPTSKELNHE
jgi:hypothetical protein